MKKLALLLQQADKFVVDMCIRESWPELIAHTDWTTQSWGFQKVYRIKDGGSTELPRIIKVYWDGKFEIWLSCSALLFRDVWIDLID